MKKSFLSEDHRDELNDFSVGGKNGSMNLFSLPLWNATLWPSEESEDSTGLATFLGGSSPAGSESSECVVPKMEQHNSRKKFSKNIAMLVSVDLLPTGIKTGQPYEILKQVQDDTIIVFQLLNKCIA